MNSKYEDIEKCSCTVIHEDSVNKVKSQMIEGNVTMELAEFFKVFGDDTRLRILYALSKCEMCVCDIAALLSMTQSAVSHQLKVLRNQRLVRYRRQGKVVYYSLDDDHIRDIFNKGLEHINEAGRGL